MTEPVLRPGDKLASTTSTAKVVVIRAPAQHRPVIACGGTPMVPAAQAPPGTADGTEGEAVLIGKRYSDAADTVELLCIASGAGVLSCDGAPMTLKAAKPLPASD